MLWLLLAACTPPAPPSLALPALPTVENAEPVDVDRFLSVTALGAKDALLCPWFRGEPVPDASLARWATEARLAWLVLEAGADGVTLAGSTDVAGRAEEARAAAATLAERCGAERAVEVLVAAAPTARYGPLFEAVGILGGAGIGTWLAAEDAAPTAFDPAATRPGQTHLALDAGGIGGLSADGRPLGGVAAGGGADEGGGVARSGGVAGGGGVGEGGGEGGGAEVGGTAEGGGAVEGSAAWAATLAAVPEGERTTCATVSAPADATWGVVVAGVDGIRAAGMARVTLGLGGPGGPAAAGGRGPASGEPAAPVAGAASGESAGRSVPLHGALAALPLTEGCDAGEPGCPCVPAR